MEKTMLDFQTIFTVKASDESTVGVYISRITAERAALKYEQVTDDMTRITEGSINQSQSLWDAEMYNRPSPRIDDKAFNIFSKLPVVSV
jgi:hypothetical protein